MNRKGTITGDEVIWNGAKKVRDGALALSYFPGCHIELLIKGYTILEGFVYLMPAPARVSRDSTQPENYDTMTFKQW